MKQTTDWRRIGIYLLFAYGIAWVTGLIIYLNGGLAHSPELIPGSRITLALVLLAIPYMWAPALAHLLTRWINREGRANLLLKPHFKRYWRYWLAAWFLPGILTVFGALIFFLLFPHYLDFGLSQLRQMLPPSFTLNLWVLVGFQLIGAMIISPVANSWATFGEEFGWRAYLLPKLMPLGWRKANALLGLIWGVWHWPVILMGYEYGFSYPGYPWLGPLQFIWIAFCFSMLLSWLTLRTQSVWPAVIGHAAINGIAAAAVIVTTGSPNPLLGPLPVGIIGSVGYALVALWLWSRLPHHVEIGSGMLE